MQQKSALVIFMPFIFVFGLILSLLLAFGSNSAAACTTTGNSGNGSQPAVHAPPALVTEARQSKLTFPN